MVKKISDKRKIAKQRRIKKRKEVQARHTHKQYKGVGKGCFAIHLANFVKKGGKKKKKDTSMENPLQPKNPYT